jgi:hypothetical protein
MITLPLVYGSEITTYHYKCILQEYVMLCYGFLNKRSPHAVLRFPVQMSPLAPCGLGSSQSMMKDRSQSMILSHSTEHDTQPISYLISKQVILYWTRGGICCPGVSTSKIRSLADLSITCRDGINHLHHSNHCSNHNIDPHHSQITSRQMGDHLSQRHKSNSTSQRMRDLHNTHDCMAKQH